MKKNAPIEVAAALIRDGDQFLICRRPLSKARGLLWEFPGGKLEPGETLPECLVRECREELDVTLDVGSIYMDLLHRYPDITIHLTLFEASIRSGIPSLLEHAEFRWITAEELPDFSFCPADRMILKQLMADAGLQ